MSDPVRMPTWQSTLSQVSKGIKTVGSALMKDSPTGNPFIIEIPLKLQKLNKVIVRELGAVAFLNNGVNETLTALSKCASDAEPFLVLGLMGDGLPRAIKKANSYAKIAFQSKKDSSPKSEKVSVARSKSFTLGQKIYAGLGIAKNLSSASKYSMYFMASLHALTALSLPTEVLSITTQIALPAVSAVKVVVEGSMRAADLYKAYAEYKDSAAALKDSAESDEIKAEHQVARKQLFLNVVAVVDTAVKAAAIAAFIFGGPVGVVAATVLGITSLALNFVLIFSKREEFLDLKEIMKDVSKIDSTEDPRATTNGDGATGKHTSVVV